MDVKQRLGIGVSNLSLSFGNKCVYDDLDFSLDIGDKVTIVGENGCGKSAWERMSERTKFRLSLNI